MNIFFKHKEIHKFTREAKGHKSIIDYFITNMKTSKVIQNIRVYRSNEIDIDRYLFNIHLLFMDPCIAVCLSSNDQQDATW